MSALTLWWIVTSDRPEFESRPRHLFALGKFLELLEPRFPNLYNGNNDSTQLVILLYRLNEGAQMKQILLLLLFSVLPSPGVGVGWTGMEEAVQITSYPATVMCWLDFCCVASFACVDSSYFTMI